MYTATDAVPKGPGLTGILDYLPPLNLSVIVIIVLSRPWCNQLIAGSSEHISSDIILVVTLTTFITDIVTGAGTKMFRTDVRKIWIQGKGFLKVSKKWTSTRPASKVSIMLSSSPCYHPATVPALDSYCAGNIMTQWQVWHDDVWPLCSPRGWVTPGAH